MRKPILILGAGGHAKKLIDVVLRSNEFYIEAIIGQENETKDELWGYKILKGDHYLLEYKNKGISSIALGVGGFTDNQRRKELFLSLREQGFTIVNLIDPSAVLSYGVKLGEGVVIFAGVVINPEVIIGNNVIVSNSSSIAHETIIEDHVLISAGVTIGAEDIVGEGSLLALGSKVISRVKIGANALVAAGAVVIKDVPDNARVYGIPAREKSS